MNWTQDQVEQAMVDVKKKAISDKAFRALLLNDPNKAIQQVTGQTVPPKMKIKIIEADPAYHLTFVLPEMVSGDLSDDELEKVAGGGTCIGDVCGAKVGACGRDN